MSAVWLYVNEYSVVICKGVQCGYIHWDAVWLYTLGCSVVICTT